MTISNFNDTITAIATPLGTGGVGVIRVSGEKALDVISKIFSTSASSNKLPEFKPNYAHYGWITELKESEVSSVSVVDEVLVLYFKAPRSFTGEDVVEIHCHGGLNVVKNILNLTIQAGARMAQRGEFTKRAFLNGKMDLSKAEAILDLIHSQTDKFSQISAHNLCGKLSENINKLRQDLIDLLSQITAAIDFPEEVPEPEYDILEDKINLIIKEINRVLGTATTSNLMRQGVKLAIAGKPNVGNHHFLMLF